MAQGSLGSLVVSLAADTAKFQGDLGRAAAIAERRMRNIKDSASRAFGALTIAATAAGGALVASLGSSLNRADNLLKLSQAAGTTVEALSSLSYAADLSGVSQDELGVGLVKLSKNAVEAAKNIRGPSAGAFKALGISVKDSNGQVKNSDVLLKEIADKFSKAADGATKTAIATELFGKSGAKLIPLLNAGADGISALQKEAEAYGLVVSTKTARAAEQFNDNLSRGKGILSGFGNLLAAELAQPLADITTKLLEGQKNTNALGEAAKVAATFIKLLASAVIGGATAFKAAGQALGAYVAALVQLAQGNFREAGTILQEGLDDAKQSIGNAIDLIGDLFKEGGAQAAQDAPKLGEQLAAPVTEGAKLTGKALADYERYLNQAITIRNDAARLLTPLGPTVEENAQAIRASMAAVNAENIKLTERTVKLNGEFLKVDESAESLSKTLRDEGIRRSLGFMSDALAGVGGRAKDVARDILDAFRRILIDKSTQQLIGLFDSLGRRSGGGFLGAIFGGIASLFGSSSAPGAGAYSPGPGGVGPHLARGGFVPIGGNAVVGDGGEAEMLRVGPRGARVIPFPRGTGGGRGSINLTVAPVNQITIQGGDQDLAQRLGPVLAQSNQDAVEAAVAKVDQLLRGGYYAARA